MQVLVVEDDIRLAEALAHILKENHYLVDVVHDGAEGSPMRKATSTTS